MIDASPHHCRVSRALLFALFCLVPLVLKAGPASAETSLLEAKQSSDRGELQSAVILLKEHLKERPGDSDARLMLARVNIDLYQGAAAEAELLRAQSAGVPRADILIPLIRALLLQSQYERVLDETVAAEITGTERQAEIAALRGDAFRGLGQATAAAIEYDRGLALVPGQVDAGLGKVRLALMGQRIEDARALLNEVVAANPSSASAWELSAEIDQSLGNYEAAEKALDKAENLARNKLMPRFKRAVARLERGDVEAAIEDINQVETQMPDFPGLYFARGLLMLRQGLVERGLESLNVYLSFDPNNLRAIYLIGLVELDLGNREKAEAMLRRYLDAVPTSATAGLALGRSLVARADFNTAIELLRPLVQDNPENPDLLALFAIAFGGVGQIGEARRLLDRAIDLSPETAGLRVASAENLLRVGKSDAAVVELDKALELDP